MNDRAAIATAAAASLRGFASTIAQTPVMIGFDGFVDSIIQVVDQRHATDAYDAVPTIARFGQKIAAAAGHSGNFELMTTLKKLGGNGPIMANAMATAGLPVTYIGALGKPEVHEVFVPFAQIATVHAIAEPGFTDALEFDDGKLMLGKYDHLSAVNQDTLDEVLGEAAFTQIVRASRFLGMVNWTMLTRLESIWERLADSVLPACKDQPRKLVFIDLADPEKRTRADLKRGLACGAKLNAHADVVFGFNLAESSQVAAVQGVAVDGEPEAVIETTASRLREALGVAGVVIHPRAGAAASILRDGKATSAHFRGPFVQKPKLSTGAGDNFNAGFCLGLLAGLPVEQCLATGTGTSGFYVREAHSPTLDQLATFLDNLPAPQA